MTYKSTKTYTHSTGLSCCFRQWKADSHCNQLHGYALQVQITFVAETLDSRGWVVDFGGMGDIKKWLEDNFDHKLLVAEDDPRIESILALSYEGIADVIQVPRVGCEAFAEYIYDYVDKWVYGSEEGRVRLESVEVREHGGNSAVFCV